jgi:proliferating cell nuclear antigen
MERPAECLVHMRTEDSVKFRTLFETLNPILCEGGVEFDKTGMTIKGLNMIIVVDMHIRADDVEDYVCNAPQLVSINFLTLYTCLSSVGQDESICFQITKKSKRAATPYMSVFIIHHSAEEEYVFSYKITLLALTQERLDIPQTDFTSVVSIPSVSFQRVLRCCDKRGTFVQICTRNQSKDKNYIIFCADGDDASLVYHMKFQVDAKDWMDQSCHKLDRYCLKYLMLITKATSLSNYVTVYLADDFVLAIKYNIGTIGEITFCVAPQIERSEGVPPAIVPFEDIFKDDETVFQPSPKAITSTSESGEMEETVEEAEVITQKIQQDRGQKIKKNRRKRKHKLDVTAKMTKQKTETDKTDDHTNTGEEMASDKVGGFSGSNIPADSVDVTDALMRARPHSKMAATLVIP